MTRREAEQVAEAILANPTLRALFADVIAEAVERRAARERARIAWIQRTLHSFPGISPPYGPCRHCGVGESPNTFNRPCPVLVAQEPAPPA
jgi:hypothetical protein